MNGVAYRNVNAPVKDLLETIAGRRKFLHS